MSSASTKKVFISHSSKDDQIALNLVSKISEEFSEDDVWIDLFDLDVGSDLASVIPEAISASNWFILLASQHSLESRWVTYEAKLATFLAIERENYQILTVKLDDAPFPKELDLQLRARKYLTLDPTNADATFRQIIELLKRESGRRTAKADIFVDRGPDMDRLELAVADAKIVYIAGITGIGKTSLIKAAARGRFQRELMQINIRAGHDLELLCRQLIKATGLPQPNISPGAVGESADELLLLDTAVWSIKEAVNEHGKALFLNHGHNAMYEDTGIFRNYFKRFLSQFEDSELEFPILLASNRWPELTASESIYSALVRIQSLPDNFMTLAIQKWYERITGDIAPGEDELTDLVRKLNGYPLAAKLIAGELAIERPERISKDAYFTRLQQGIAEYLISNIYKSKTLDDLDRAILYTLAIYGGPVSNRYLRSVTSVKKFSEDQIDKSLSKLSRMMIIESDMDVYSVHNFLANYFLDQSKKQNLFKEIAKQLADLAYLDTERLVGQLGSVPERERKIENRGYVSMTHQLLSVAEPAHRLSLASGYQNRLKNFPFKLRGHLREMVFTMYRDAKDYEEAVRFADEWLTIDPNDTEIGVYKARALRRLHRYREANALLDDLEELGSQTVYAKVMRERGLIADQDGHLDEAIDWFRKGRIKRQDGKLVYYQINVDLARSLIARAGRRWDDDATAKSEYEEAIERLEEAEEVTPRFDQESLDILVKVKYKLGQLTIDDAVTKLENAIKFQPTNGRLYFRAAEILSDDKTRLVEALKYALEAQRLGDNHAFLTIGDIYNKQGQYQKALDALEKYNPPSDRDAVVAKVAKARALTHIDPVAARKILSQLDHNNIYVEHARIEAEILSFNKALQDANYLEARQYLQRAKDLLNNVRVNFSGAYFDKLTEEVEAGEKRLKQLTST